eukprot:SAG31_NODE_5244_length_2653_cov_3.354738_1_plen_239_part_00
MKAALLSCIAALLPLVVQPHSVTIRPMSRNSGKHLTTSRNISKYLKKYLEMSQLTAIWLSSPAAIFRSETRAIMECPAQLQTAPIRGWDCVMRARGSNSRRLRALAAGVQTARSPASPRRVSRDTCKSARVTLSVTFCLYASTAPLMLCLPCWLAGCYWFSQGCSIGCKSCTGGDARSNKDLCGSGMKPTICDARLRTYNLNAKCGSADDLHKHNPWRAPCVRCLAAWSASLVCRVIE